MSYFWLVFSSYFW